MVKNKKKSSKGKLKKKHSRKKSHKKHKKKRKVSKKKQKFVDLKHNKNKRVDDRINYINKLKFDTSQELINENDRNIGFQMRRYGKRRRIK